MSSAAFRGEADKKLEALAAKQEEFSSLSPAAKGKLCEELLAALRAAQDDLPTLANAAVLEQGFVSASGADANMPWCLEQILVAQWVTSFCGRFKTTCAAFAKTGKATPAKMVTRRDDGRYVANVFPLDSADGMKPNKDCKCDLWIQQGKEPTQGASFSYKPRPNSVGICLGAGNVAALGVMDCLHLLFQQNTVVLFKLHPVRTYLEDFARKLFKPLMEQGYFDIIKEESGVPDAQYLVSHPLLCNIHMTGSTETHDAIVWGGRDERKSRREKNNPVTDLNKVTVTSELGCVTPYMVCPGSWKPEEVKHHALHLAVAMTANNGYYCNSPKVLVLADKWPQKEAFLGVLRAILAGMPALAPYYPGSHRRYQGFEEAYGERLEKIKGPGFGESERHGEHIPWTMVSVSADPANLEASKGEYALRNEPFCPMLTVCTLKGVSSADEYLEIVPRLANECIWGRLSCTLVVHPETQAASAEALDKAIAALEYGSVVINAWSSAAYSYDTGCWGAYGGGDPPLERVECVESGIGMVNNALSFDHIEKCVVTTPFIDKAVQIGTGPRLTRDGTLNLTNFFINPGAMSLLRMLCPALFSPGGKAMGCLVVVVAGVCVHALL